jgi:hypothetical protein
MSLRTRDTLALFAIAAAATLWTLGLAPDLHALFGWVAERL